MALSEELRRRILGFQKNEITEYHIYHRLARMVKDPENARVLARIGDDEKHHYDEWREISGADVEPDRRKIAFYYWIARILGVTFGIKLMEAGEDGAEEQYAALGSQLPQAERIAREEDAHEQALIAMLDEERLRYAGSVVLGLNDALVELTGALAGLTLALRNTDLIALSGLITGIAAAFSMAASEYLSTKDEADDNKHPVKASVYTGVAYLGTVALLILPYLVLPNYYLCLACSLVAAVGIIALFNYYISVAKGESFRRRFGEMAGLSLGVATLSFGMGWLLRALLGVEV